MQTEKGSSEWETNGGTSCGRTLTQSTLSICHLFFCFSDLLPRATVSRKLQFEPFFFAGRYRRLVVTWCYNALQWPAPGSQGTPERGPD